MPAPPNLRRRRALADAAIEVLARAGVHGLSHRAVDAQAEVPAGTTSNYFRSRDALLQAVAERVVELHRAEMEAANAQAPAPVGREQLAELIGGSLYHSATAARTRYLAVYELTLEATRRPELARTLAGIAEATLDFTVQQHRDLGLPTSRAQVLRLMELFGGALFYLVAGSFGEPSPEEARGLAQAIVTGVLGSAPDPGRES